MLWPRAWSFLTCRRGACRGAQEEARCDLRAPQAHIPVGVRGLIPWVPEVGLVLLCPGEGPGEAEVRAGVPRAPVMVMTDGQAGGLVCKAGSTRHCLLYLSV